MKLEQEILKLVYSHKIPQTAKTILREQNWRNHASQFQTMFQI